MNYTEIIDSVLAYADRESDAELDSDRLDKFIKIMESKANRKLKVLGMSTRSQLTSVADQEYYGLPSDYSGLRNIKIFDPAAPKKKSTLIYTAPEQMDLLSTVSANEVLTEVYYNIEADQLRIIPYQENNVIEIIYYQKVPNLNSIDSTNWLSDSAPDAYIFGLMVEVSSFVKDKESAIFWNERFESVLEELQDDDDSTRWSGPYLQMRVG